MCDSFTAKDKPDAHEEYFQVSGNMKSRKPETNYLLFPDFLAITIGFESLLAHISVIKNTDCVL